QPANISPGRRVAMNLITCESGRLPTGPLSKPPVAAVPGRLHEDRDGRECDGFSRLQNHCKPSSKVCEFHGSSSSSL
ncbi:MAG: hypothetical protein KDA96_23920, partial [Planctomycetaceae bacterium]|nr:hypothetical protein [Planctomycetaceae bacterium]